MGCVVDRIKSWVELLHDDELPLLGCGRVCAVTAARDPEGNLVQSS